MQSTKDSKLYLSELKVDEFVRFLNFLHAHAVHMTVTFPEARAFQVELNARLDELLDGIVGVERKDLQHTND